MTHSVEYLKAELIDKVLGLARSRLDPGKAILAERFIRQYYANVPPSDLAQADSERLFGAAMALWSFARSRRPGQAKLRLYNPGLEEFGWTSEHTVIEIVNDDMPFLVDSITAELTRQGLRIHSLIHPIMRVRRDGASQLAALLDADSAEADVLTESLMHIEVDQLSEHEEICAELEHVLADVRAAVADWQTMGERLLEVEAALQTCPLDPAEVVEARDFLRWLHDGHFTLLGYRRINFSGETGIPIVSQETGSGLGILRDPDMLLFDEMRSLSSMPAEVRSFLRDPQLLLIAKAARMSTVHRPVPMDVVGVKVVDDEGWVEGMHVFSGLFTSAAYTRSPSQIPVLRRKIDRCLKRSGFRLASHDGKALLNILETYPRDELFQIDDNSLFETAQGILHVYERPRVALFVRRDEFGRFFSCLVFVPRDRYDTQLRHGIQSVLEAAFGGTVSSYYTQVADHPLARLHFIVKTMPGPMPEFDLRSLEARIAAISRNWADHLQDALVAAHGEERGLILARRYGQAFPASYRERHGVQAAVADIDHIEQVLDGADIGMSLFRTIEAADDEARFKLFHAGSTVPLSDVLPMLENMGFKVIAEMPHHLRLDQASVWIHDFAMAASDGGAIDIAHLREPFQEAFLRVWRGEAENDGFNRLVARAGLNWREVTVLRAYAKYLRQVGFTFSQASIQRALYDNAEIASLIVRLFLDQFDPAASEDETTALEAACGSLDAVSNADDDRILRRFVNLVCATLRTNYFQDGGAKPYLSFKLDSRSIEDLPLPRPWVEVYVYSPRVEAIHLRGGKVARGGIRWSDRREDFRTEILGLMKAQMVKNTVIVPVGSKGGFVVKQPPVSAKGESLGREAFQAEGIACYRTLMRGLLDLTDSRKGAEIIPPPDVVRRDGDDPYLVVAADKGTATFSDIANGISLDYGFWLGDAFASGGSHGYDHKAMGITARGAWESVKRHFRERGLDTQTTDFTVIGVGDMSGDVFGNGMLRSRHIRLIAAFNHAHIFIDPEPDAESSFRERERLFTRSRSQWSDYDPALISPGGGVFSRLAKTVPLSPQIRARFGLDADHVTPSELIRAVLCAEADLLWFGGIGTYVKASDQSQVDAGDRANDAVRVDGRALRAKVVGEGANLAVTQLGRIEYALTGGRINTDAIDNSAGVDTSDHEVNIKILLNEIVANGDLTMKQRDELLTSMTDEVAVLVLRDNYLQSQALTMMEAQAADLLDHHIRLMRMLEKQGRLNRAIEFLPDDETLAERAAARRGLTRPELAVLLAYTKIWVYESVLDSDLPDDPELAGDLVRYFPTALRERYEAEIKHHRLRRELIATSITNSMINRVGVHFVSQLTEKTGMGPVDIARAYLITRDMFGLRETWDAIEALDAKVPAAAQTAMLLEANRLIDRGAGWVLRYCLPPLDIGAIKAELTSGICTLRDCLDATLPPEGVASLGRRAAELTVQGVPEELANRIPKLIVLASACDIVRIAARKNRDVADIGRLYFAAASRFGLGWLRVAAERIAGGSHWQKLAVAAMIEELYAHQRDLTLAIANATNGEAPAEAVTVWAAGHPGAVERTDQLLNELRLAGHPDLAMLAVANRQLRALTEG